MDLFLPVQRENNSRIFGEKLEDFQLLAQKLGNLKLSRIKASELNIYARGSVQGVQAHLRELNKSQGGIPENVIIEALKAKPAESNEYKPPLDV